MSHQTYEEYRDEAFRRWQDQGAKVASEYVEGVIKGSSGEFRGRLLALLAEFKTYTGERDVAVGLYGDALELLTTPEHRFLALAKVMDVCVVTRRFKQGVRFALAAEEIRASGAEIAPRWLGVYHMNNGRLSLKATDYVDASEHFVLAVRYFRETGENEQEALRAEVFLAEVLMLTGKMDDALAMCRKVRVNAQSRFVRNDLNVLQGKIALRMNDFNNANRFAMQAVEETVAKLGEQDAETWVRLITLIGEIVSRENPAMATDILRVLVEKLASNARVDVNEIMRGVEL